MSVHLKPEHLRRAESLLAETRANGGLAPLDLAAFWADQDRGLADPWSECCPRIPLLLARMSRECVFDELGEKEDWWRLFHDEEYACALSRRYNDKAEEIVGRRLLPETPRDPLLAWPEVRALHDIFEARNTWESSSWSYWIHPSAHDPEQLSRLLDRVEDRLQDLRAFILPHDWQDAKDRLLPLGCKPPIYRGQRGPVTFATSIFGVENLIYLIEDDPALAARFRDLILRSMLERARILDQEAGYTPESAPRGFWFADDNCALLNSSMYAFFGAPILQAVFERYAPEPGHTRHQHSDSDMGHLLPILAELGLNKVNFGPNLTVSEIRHHLPKATIDGQLAPFTFSRHEEVNLVAEFLRDAEMIRDSGTRGLLFATAGSINAGSRLSGLRLLMAACQRWGAY